MADQTPKQTSTDDKINYIEIQIQDTTDIMKQNINHMIERGEKIEYLETVTENCKNNAQVFKTNAQKLKYKMCCQNYKVTVAIIFVVILVSTVIIVPIVLKYTANNNNNNNNINNNGNNN